jgi:hypothetical protein
MLTLAEPSDHDWEMLEGIDCELDAKLHPGLLIGSTSMKN